jgi:hypothetical protein
MCRPNQLRRRKFHCLSMRTKARLPVLIKTTFEDASGLSCALVLDEGFDALVQIEA